MFDYRLLCVTMAVTLIASPVLASTIGSVGGPTVKANQAQLDYRIGFSDGDDNSSQDSRLRQRVHYDYGFNDIYALRGVLLTDKRRGGDVEFDALRIENRFHIYDGKNYDAGLRVAYNIKDGDKKPDTAFVGGYQQVKHSGWTFRLNEFLTGETGADREGGLDFELRAQAVYELDCGTKIGLESFSDFGQFDDMNAFDEQSHTIGPVVKGQIFGDYSYETGYRFGVTDGSPDHSLKFFINRNF